MVVIYRLKRGDSPDSTTQGRQLQTRPRILMLCHCLCSSLALLLFLVWFPMLLCLGLLTQRWITGLGRACASLHRHFPMSARYLQRHQQVFAIVGPSLQPNALSWLIVFEKANRDHCELTEVRHSPWFQCQRGSMKAGSRSQEYQSVNNRFTCHRPVR